MKREATSFNGLPTPEESMSASSAGTVTPKREERKVNMSFSNTIEAGSFRSKDGLSAIVDLDAEDEGYSTQKADQDRKKRSPSRKFPLE